MSNFKDQKILIMGLGLHGGGLALAKYLRKEKALLTITDLKKEQELKASLSKLAKYKDIKYTLGRHDIQDFKEQDLIIQNPGVPSHSPYLKVAQENNIPIVNEAVMFFGLYPGQIIGITGTRGKSTTATLIHKLLKKKIKGNVLAGNIATVPMFTVLDKIKATSYPVLELSSWHLEGLGNYQRSPHIAVITNVFKDHLNRYQSFSAYQKAKLINIKYQKKRDFAILNADHKITLNFAQKTKAQVYFFSLEKKVKGAYLENNDIYFNNSKIISLKDIKLLGKHNLENILAALVVAKILKVSHKDIKKVISSFKGLEYRLEKKGKVRNFEIFNDATSSSPEATIAALNFLEKKPIILIAGGEDKNLAYHKLAQKIKEKVKFLLLLDGSGSEKLGQELNKINYPSYQMITGINSLKEAYRLAFKHGRGPDSYLLFSPAAASFNMFLNEFARAKEFNKLINEKKKK